MHLLLSRADESLELIFTKKKCVCGGNVSFTFFKKKQENFMPKWKEACSASILEQLYL